MCSAQAAAEDADTPAPCEVMGNPGLKDRGVESVKIRWEAARGLLCSLIELG